MAITDPWSCDLAELRQAAFAPPAPVQKPPELQQLDAAFAEFMATCPDFNRTEANCRALLDHIVNPFDATADDFKRAHALATYGKMYAPVTQQLDTNPETMPLDQLRRVAGGHSQVPEPEPSLEELHEQAFPVTQEQDAAAWSMPMEDLREQAFTPKAGTE